MALIVYSKTNTAVYEEMEDELVVELAKCGDSLALEHLMKKYMNFVRAKSRTYFLVGADKDDIIQEGMIGLYKSIRDFNSMRLSSFKAFAEMCITRQIITAIKTATRQKHIPLNSYISLNKPLYDEESDKTLLDFIVETKVKDPEELFISREDFGMIEFHVKNVLSKLESEVLALYVEGMPYQEIALCLKRHLKSVDNALQRVKKKLEKHLKLEEFENLHK